MTPLCTRRSANYAIDIREMLVMLWKYASLLRRVDFNVQYILSDLCAIGCVKGIGWLDILLPFPDEYVCRATNLLDVHSVFLCRSGTVILCGFKQIMRRL